MSRILDWYNENSLRAYPFVEDADMQLSGPAGVILSTAFLLDLRVSLFSHPGDVSFVDVSKASDQLTVAFLLGAERVELVVPLTAETPYTLQVYTDDYAVSAVFGDGILRFSDVADGVYTGSIAVEPRCVSSQTTHRVDSLNGLVGDVKLQEGHNCRIIIDGQTVRVSAVQGAGMGINCNSYVTSYPCTSVLTRINGIRGSTSGEFNFEAGAGVIITPKPDEHAIEFTVDKDQCELKCGGA